MKKVLYTLYAAVLLAAWILSVDGVVSAERIAPMRATSLELCGDEPATSIGPMDDCGR
jgi:hypothetical protein